MKTSGMYLINPAKRNGKKRSAKKGRSRNPIPFAVMTVNPAKKKRRRNPSEQLSLFDGSSDSRPAARKSAVTRKVGSPGWHHKRGTFIYNPPGNKSSPATKPSRKSKRNRRKISPPLVQETKMKTKRRRSSKRTRTRNPASRSTRRRSSRRNPARRRRSSVRRMRNPVGTIKELFTPDMLTTAFGLTVGVVGTTAAINWCIATPAGAQQPRFKLPGVDFQKTGPDFWAANKWPLLVYRTAIPAIAGFFLKNQSPRMSRALMLSATYNAVSGAINNSGVLKSVAGVGRNYGGGVGFVPGTPTQLTNPAQRFLTMNNVPRARGMGAMVGPGMLDNTQSQVEGAFRGAN